MLAGCSNAGITTKTQLIKESQIFEQNSHRQDTALSRLSKELEATVALYDQLVPDSDLDELNVSLEARDATVAELTKLNKAQAELSATFKNTVKQDNKKLSNKSSKSVDAEPGYYHSRSRNLYEILGQGEGN
ncbi:hypothetical protein [Amylolactobacillus amylophilus]|uniref:hypothetical protein n=1 Tax=Amylolactobacillus amylophilus TaxID=1603 RepID=UPI0006D11359|nr:hypothetical protein [Amylolactobacillus amylophilus]